jgi:hypothetical protein
MKRSVILLGILASVISCSEQKKEKRPAKVDSLISTMAPKPDTDTSTVAEAISSETSEDTVVKKGAAVEIKGTVYYSLPYCAGIAPSPEIQEGLKKTYRLYSSTIRLQNKSGSYTITTDKNGNFTASVPPGEYDVWLTKEIDPTIYDVRPENCDKCLTERIATATISSGKNNRISFRFKCDPNARRRP